MKPIKDQKIMLAWQGRTDGTNEGFEVNGMLAIGAPDGVTYVTREQAKEFFGLREFELSKSEIDALPGGPDYGLGDHDAGLFESKGHL